jgi:hypothetical protein
MRARQEVDHPADEIDVGERGACAVWVASGDRLSGLASQEWAHHEDRERERDQREQV